MMLYTFPAHRRLRSVGGSLGGLGEGGAGPGPVVPVGQSLRVAPVDTWDAFDPAPVPRTRAMTALRTIRRSVGRGFARLLLATVALGGLSLTGCQVDVGGQTLPSAYYLQDDIQYFPAGPEFKLSKEAAAQKAYKKELGDAGSCTGNCSGGCQGCGR